MVLLSGSNVWLWVISYVNGRLGLCCLLINGLEIGIWPREPTVIDGYTIDAKATEVSYLIWTFDCGWLSTVVDKIISPFYENAILKMWTYGTPACWNQKYLNRLILKFFTNWIKFMLSCYWGNIFRGNVLLNLFLSFSQTADAQRWICLVLDFVAFNW